MIGTEEKKGIVPMAAASRILILAMIAAIAPTNFGSTVAANGRNYGTRHLRADRSSRRLTLWLS